MTKRLRRNLLTIAFGLAALSPLLTFKQTPINVAADGPIVVTFTIINDNQALTPITLDAPGLITAPAFVARRNVRLDGWYVNTGLNQTFDFQTAVTFSQTLYARWDYLVDIDGKAILSPAETATSFASGTLTLALDLYEPLRVDVTYQWQIKLETDSDWRNIVGADQQTFAPVRNGLHGYRVLYRTPVYDIEQQVIDTVRHESASIWIEIYGEIPWLAITLSLGFLLMFAIVYFLSYRWPVTLIIDGVVWVRLRFRAGTDISDMPLPAKDGYVFSGWHRDAALTSKADLGRMIQRSLTLHGKFHKQDQE